MSRPAIGTRVIAIKSASAEKHVVRSYGQGTYEGLVPVRLEGVEILNPKIRLDSGGVVYGMECWWGPVQTMQDAFPDHRFEWVTVLPPNVKGEHDKEEKQCE